MHSESATDIPVSTTPAAGTTDRTAMTLALLATASGVCGIAYELLYARLLTTYLGDMFQVAAAILASFLLGLAGGAYIAHRLVRYLWIIEIAIGLYGAALAWAAGSHSQTLLAHLAPMAAGGTWVILGMVFAILCVPAFLVGTGVPLFTLYVHAHASQHAGRSFRRVYLLYNLGAAGCVLAVEYVLLRSMGVTGTLYAMAAVNLFTGLILRYYIPPLTAPAPRPAVKRGDGPAPLQLASIFAMSVLSGVFQLLLLKMAETVFGPYHENFAILLAMTLGCLTIGAAVAGLRGVTFSRLLFVGAAPWPWR